MATVIPQLLSNPAEDQGPELKKLTIALCVVSTLFVAVRLFVRSFVVKAIGWDDWLILASGAASLAAMIIVTKAVDQGLGRHMGDVPLPNMIRALFWVFVDQSLLVVTQVLTKLSVGATLLRIAVHRGYRIAIYATSVFMIVYLLVMLFVFNLQCKDVRMSWDPTILPRKCIAQSTMVKITYVIGSCNILTDLIFAIFIPFPMIWHLNTNRRTKAAAMFVISLGALACAGSLARMPYLVNFGSTFDSLWAMAPVALWTVVETEVAIIAACIPSLKPLVKSILASSIVTSFRQRSRKGGDTTGNTNGSGGPLSTPHTHATYPNSKKEFSRISERGTTKSGTDDESDETASVRALVHDHHYGLGINDVPMGSIQKETTAEVAEMRPDEARVQRDSHAQSKYTSWGSPPLRAKTTVVSVLRPDSGNGRDGVREQYPDRSFDAWRERGGF